MAAHRKIKTILIDDESHAIRSLNVLCNEFTEKVEVIGKATKTLEAIKLINSLEPELIFLDIELSDGTGFDILETVKHSGFFTVFTTAHSEYAIEAIKAKAFDYLMKPINIDEFSTTVDKVFEAWQLNSDFTQSSKTHSNISIPTESGFKSININQIVLVNAEGSYTEIITSNEKPLLISRKLGQVEKALPSDSFFRANHSCIVNLKQVEEFNRKENTLTLGNKIKVDVSRRKKDELIEALQKFTQFI